MINKFYDSKKQKLIDEGKQLQVPQSVIDADCAELEEQRHYDLAKFAKAQHILEFYKSRKQRILELGAVRKAKKSDVERSLAKLRDDRDKELIEFFDDY